MNAALSWSKRATLVIQNNPEYQISDKSPPRKTRPGVNGEDLIISLG